MSIIVVVRKNNRAIIAADTAQSAGSLKVAAKYLDHHSKLFQCNNSYVGIAGWLASAEIFSSLCRHHIDEINFDGRQNIFDSALKIHKWLKEDYFIETSEGEKDQPVESSQLDALIVNPYGIFELESYRSVTQYSRFWAIGSGQPFALGAMEAVYDETDNIEKIAEAGIHAACAFDDACMLPLHKQLVELNPT